MSTGEDEPDLPALLVAVTAGLLGLQRRWITVTDHAWSSVVRAQDTYVRAVASARGPTGRRAAARTLRRTVDTAMAEVAATAREQLPRVVAAAWERGARTSAAEGARAVAVSRGAGAAEQARAADRAARLVAMTGGDAAATARATTELLSDVLAGTGHVSATTRDLVRRVAAPRIAGLLRSGGTPQATAAAITRELAGHGITAVVYRNGARHGLAEYAQMLVRTKTAVAFNDAGIAQARAAGAGWMQIMDGAGCGLRNHRDPEKANGMIVTVDVAAAHPAAHPNCCMTGTVSGFYGPVVEMARAWYAGPAFTLSWSTPAGQHTATVGPHHPVATDRGWVEAHQLAVGDELVYDTRAPLPVTGGEPDLEQVPSRIEDVFDALWALGPRTRVAASGDYLHGDGVFCQDEIEIVGAAGFLLPVGDPGPVEHGRERALVGADVRSPTPRRGSPVDELLERVDLPPDSIVRGFDHRSPLGGGLPSVVQREGVTLAPGQTQRTQPLPDRGTVHPDEPADLGARQPLAYVELDQPFVGHSRDGHRFLQVRLDAVTVTEYEGWVYDATTQGGAFTADGIVVRNCVRVCTARPDIRTAEEARSASSLTTPGQDADQAYVSAVRAQAARDRATRRAWAARNPRDPASGAATSPAARRRAAKVARRRPPAA